MQIRTSEYPIEIFTGYFQVSGVIDSRGEPASFINDERQPNFTIRDGTMTPLTKGVPVGEITPPSLIYMPKDEVEVFIVGDYPIAEAKPMPKTILMACYTDTYVIRGYYHMPAEVKADDVFKVVKGPFFAVSNAEIYTLRPTAMDIRGEAELLYINGDSVRIYYEELTGDEPA